MAPTLNNPGFLPGLPPHNLFGNVNAPTIAVPNVGPYPAAPTALVVNPAVINGAMGPQPPLTVAASAPLAPLPGAAPLPYVGPYQASPTTPVINPALNNGAIGPQPPLTGAAPLPGGAAPLPLVANGGNAGGFVPTVGQATSSGRWNAWKNDRYLTVKPSQLGAQMSRNDVTLARVIRDILHLQFIDTGYDFDVLNTSLGEYSLLDSDEVEEIEEQIESILSRSPDKTEARTRLIIDALLLRCLSEMEKYNLVLKLEDKGCDYVVPRRFLIETKKSLKTDKEIDHGLVQLFHYMMVQQCAVGFLTDGDQWFLVVLIEGKAVVTLSGSPILAHIAALLEMLIMDIGGLLMIIEQWVDDGLFGNEDDDDDDDDSDPDDDDGDITDSDSDE